MGRKDDHPKLKASGVYAANTTGNGNCLFHALSDQMYGHQNRHVELRNAVVGHMSSNPEQYKSFIVVHPGGGLRRNPKRKNAGTYSAPVNGIQEPTEADIEATFQRYLKTMAQGGAYGDNMEIVAFASLFEVNVYVFSESTGDFFAIEAPGRTRTLYIVHHAYEHFSSIRNTAGPHQGLPNVELEKLSPEAEATMQAELASYSYVQKWMIDEVLRSLPPQMQIDRHAIESAIQASRGNVNEVVSNLLPASSPSSANLSGTSSPASIERDQDSDFDMEQKPKKKQDRRQSRPHPLKPKQHLTVRTKDTAMLSPNPNHLTAALSKLKNEKTEQTDPDETEEEDWRNESTSISTSVSDSSTNSKGEVASSPARLKLLQPKKVAQVRSSSITSSEQSNAENSVVDTDGDKRSRIIAKPRGRLISGNERRRLAEQRTARLSNTALHQPSKKQNQSTPAINMAIKVLSI